MPTKTLTSRQHELYRQLYYDPLTGVFLWKTQPARRIQVGDVAGSINYNGKRRIQIEIDGEKKNYPADRLAWIYMYGDISDEVRVVHRNNEPDDNRICNLEPKQRSAKRKN